MKRHLVFIYNTFIVNRPQLYTWKNKPGGGSQFGWGGGRGAGVSRQWQHCRYLRACIIQKQKAVHGACWCSCSNHCGRQTSPITWWCRKQRRPRRSSKYIHFIAFLYPVLLTLLLHTPSGVTTGRILFTQTGIVLHNRANTSYMKERHSRPYARYEDICASGCIVRT